MKCYVLNRVSIQVDFGKWDFFSCKVSEVEMVYLIQQLWACTVFIEKIKH